MQGREEVFANVSAGADKKSEHSGPVRAPSSLLEHLQRQVALKPVSESGSSLGAEAVLSKAAGTGEGVSMGADKKANTLGRRRT